MNTLTRDRLNDILEIANVDLDNIRTDYSGRLMYGGTCLAVTMEQSDPPRFYAAIGYVQGVAEAEDPGYDDDLMKLVDAARTDSMGTGVVVYFPGWTLNDQ